MSGEQSILPTVTDRGKKEFLNSIEAIVREEMLALQEAAEQRLVSLRQFLDKIDDAASLSELEECEQQTPFRLEALSGRFDEVLDSLERRLETAEEEAVQQALARRLDIVTGEGAAGDAGSLGTPSPTDLVQHLRDFLTAAEKNDPAVEVAEQELTMARTALQTLRAQQADVGKDPKLHALNRYEIEELSPLVVDLALLVSILNGAQTLAANESPEIGRHVLPQEPIEEEPSQIEVLREEPEIPDSPALIPLSSGDIARFEEDYYRHSVKFHSWLRKAATDAHSNELDEFKAHLDQRREELSRWRENPGYTGEPPRLLADFCPGPLRDKSKVPGTTRRRKKKNGAHKQETNGKYTSEEVSQILQDFANPERSSRGGGRPGRKGNFNGRVFLTTGQINPRANKRR